MANVVITGANRGIGYELAKQYHSRGDTVIATCRTASEALMDLGVSVFEGVDVCDSNAVQDFAHNTADLKVDILINNAGILSQETLDDMDFHRIERQFEVNTLGPLRMVCALMPHFTDGSKIGIISSRVGSMADNHSGGIYGYRISKAAVNMVGVNLAHDLKPKGIAVALLHPGFVRTDMTGGNGNILPAQSANGLIERMDALTIESTGQFWHEDGEALPW